MGCDNRAQEQFPDKWKPVGVEIATEQELAVAGLI
jgi:hypothetical protein